MSKKLEASVASDVLISIYHQKVQKIDCQKFDMKWTFLETQFERHFFVYQTSVLCLLLLLMLLCARFKTCTILFSSKPYTGCVLLDGVAPKG